MKGKWGRGGDYFYERIGTSKIRAGRGLEHGGEMTRMEDALATNSWKEIIEGRGRSSEQEQ